VFGEFGKLGTPGLYLVEKSIRYQGLQSQKGISEKDSRE
jgi:hypothetical protein